MASDQSKIDDYRAAVISAVLCARMLAQHDLPKLLHDIEHAHAVGPILDPTLYRGASRAMSEDAEILKAAMPLYQIGKSLEAAGG
jgi:hypothetical protein